MAPIDRIAQVLRGALGGAIKDEAATFDAAAQQTATGVHSAMQSVFGGGFSIDDLLLLIPGVGELLTLPGNAFKAIFGKAGEFILGVGAGWALGEFAAEALRPLWLEITHLINDQFQSEIFDPQTAAMLQSKGIIDDAYGRSEAGGGNLSGEHYDKLVDAAQVRPTIGQLLDMWLRGDISEADVDGALERNGIPSFWHGPLKATRRNLLSPADLALANLRGIISEQTMQGYADVLGITADDMAVLIGNTGEPPGATEMMEALRRGFVDEATFDRAIRQSRIRNEWIPTMLKLRLAPMSTADAIRAVIENYITSDEGQAIAVQNGLMPEHWPILRDSWGRPLAHEQMMTLYHRGEATLDEVRQAMRESDVKDKYIDQAIELGRRLVPERQVVSMLDHGVISPDTAHTMLAELGYSQADAEAMIRLGTAQRVTSHKTLSKGDTIAMYEDALITRQAAIEHLHAIGYADADAVAMLDLADYKRKTALLKLTEREIQAAHRAGHATDAQAVDQLVKAGLDSAQAHNMVDLWNGEKRIVTRTLTESQTVKAAKDGLISDQDARQRLRAMGFDDADVTILMELGGAEPPPGAQPAVPPPTPPAPGA